MNANMNRRQWTLILGLFLAVISGLGVAVQSKINGALGQELGDPVAAALYSFGSGWVLCVLFFLATSSRARQSFGRFVRDLRSGALPWWSLFGGISGAVLVFSQSAIVVTIGLAAFTIAVVAGTTLGGIVMDAYGVSGVVRKLNLLRGLGAAITMIAVLVMVSSQLAGTGVWLLALLPLIAGFMTSWQQATIGLVRHSTGSVTLATLVSFTAGTLLLGAVKVGQGLIAPVKLVWPTDPVLYLGGILGFMFILVIAIVVQRIGVLMLTMSMTTGQLIASLVLDVYFPDGNPITGMSYFAVGLAVVGVITAALGLRASRDTKNGVSPDRPGTSEQETSAR